jgi:hypothetical protein
MEPEVVCVVLCPVKVGAGVRMDWFSGSLDVIYFSSRTSHGQSKRAHGALDPGNVLLNVCVPSRYVFPSTPFAERGQSHEDITRCIAASDQERTSGVAAAGVLAAGHDASANGGIGQVVNGRSLQKKERHVEITYSEPRLY